MNPGNRYCIAALKVGRLHRLLLPTFMLSLGVGSAHAQSDALREGVRVQLETRSTRSIVGVVKSLDPDSVRLYTDGNGATLSVPREEIEGIRVSRGKSASRGAMRGAMWGTAVGAVAAAIVVVSLQTDDSYAAADGEAVNFALNSLLGGAVWGAGIGAFVKSERWERVSMRPRITGSSSGVRLGFSLQPAILH